MQCAALAQAASTSLQLGAWLALGALGLVWAPSLAAAFVPVALWLLGTGLLKRWARHAGFDARAAGWAIAAGALGVAAALSALEAGAGFAALLSASLCWSVLTVASTHAARLLTCAKGSVRRHALPKLAAAGAMAWLFHALDDPHRVMQAAVWLTLAAAGGFAWLLRGTADAMPRASEPPIASRPMAAARFVMPAMMATLAWQAQACRGPALTLDALLVIHLAAMFVPGALFERIATTPMWQARLRATAVGLLAAGGLSAACAPLGLLHAAAALQGAAWSLACLAPLPRRAAPASAAVDALLVVALGAAIARYGVAALAAVHVGLGVWAMVAHVCEQLAARRSPAHLPTPAFTCQVKQSFD